MTGGDIRRFTGNYRYLSNFFPCRVVMPDTISYPSSEHAFQAGKTTSIARRQEIALIGSPGDAKVAGRLTALRPGWEDMKRFVMLQVLLAKFRQNPKLAQMLTQTGNASLIEGNTWHDNYWGDCFCEEPGCQGNGKNYLGRLLQSVRLVVLWEPRGIS